MWIPIASSRLTMIAASGYPFRPSIYIQAVRDILADRISVLDRNHRKPSKSIGKMRFLTMPEGIVRTLMKPIEDL